MIYFKFLSIMFAVTMFTATSNKARAEVQNLDSANDKSTTVYADEDCDEEDEDDCEDERF